MLTSHIFIQLIIILIVVQVFGYLCQFIGQPRVIGEVLAGLALGPTLLGAVLPRVEAAVFTGSTLPTLQTLGDIGLVLYMFSLGTHMDTHAMLKHGRKATVVSLSGVLLPLTMGALFAFFLYPEFAGPKANLMSFMLLIGTAMAITAFPVLARLLEERGILGTKIGTLALLCAAIDDVVGWCLLALVIAIIHAIDFARRQRHALIPLDPSNWRRLFVHNGRVLSALPELDEEHPLQRPEREGSLLAVLKTLPVMQKRVSAQIDLDQELSEGEKTLLRPMLNIDQGLPADEQTLLRFKLSIGSVEPESATIYAFLDIQQNEHVVQRIAIKENQVVIGRVDPKRGIRPDIDLTQFDTSSTVSRRHAKISLDRTNFSIEDLESRNKTRLVPLPRLLSRIAPGL
jgi:Sodium/hydrogen exchanger family/FHA domain